jgi:hypothetical protein
MSIFPVFVILFEKINFKNLLEEKIKSKLEISNQKNQIIFDLLSKNTSNQKYFDFVGLKFLI